MKAAEARREWKGCIAISRGSRVLEARYGANINRIVVPKGKAGWLAYISEFVEEAKASGLVQKAIDRAEERGITVSAPGDSK
jgi:polar amino acid transport system substrate-binding protein